MNVYDSDRMLSVLAKHGLSPEPDVTKADIILINTCSIRAKSEHKVLSLLGQLRPLKEANPHKVIGVTGCVGQRMGRSLLQKVPHLDLVLGPDGIDRVGSLVEAVVQQGKRLVDASLDTGGRRYSQPALVNKAKTVEFLTVIKGCDHFCTYCIVPFVRGREKSRSVAEVVDDVKKLVARGTREVIFLGQNINTYGKGTGETLAQLVEAAEAVDGLSRIRYVTSHPRDLGEDLMSQFGRVGKLCPQLHLPFQSGSDAILKKMMRLYTRDDYLKKIDRLKFHCPDISFSTDVIIGFPGETEAEFEETLEVIRRVRFGNVYLFNYSARPGTRAVNFSDEVPEAVKEERMARAQQLTNAIAFTENEKSVGRIKPCLMESMDKKGLFYTGRSLENRLVHVLNAGEATLGKIIDVEITEANGSNLRGFYVGAPREERINPVGNREFKEAVSASV
jgi:tRNA-2-methylthio-N6-dimethylallyladenosine synthase